MSKGPEISNIQVSQKIPETFKMSVSDVNLSGPHPKVMVRAIQMKPALESPKMAFRFNVAGIQKTISFSLPILINKYTEKVEMTREKFTTVWKDITHNRPSSFQKVDQIYRNPAPSHVQVQEVLKKMANLLSNCMNLRVLPPEDHLVQPAHPHQQIH